MTLGVRVERMEPVPTGGDAVPDAIDRLLSTGVDTAGLGRALNRYGYHVTIQTCTGRYGSGRWTNATIWSTFTFRVF